MSDNLHFLHTESVCVSSENFLPLFLFSPFPTLPSSLSEIFYKLFCFLKISFAVMNLIYVIRCKHFYLDLFMPQICILIISNRSITIRYNNKSPHTLGVDTYVNQPKLHIPRFTYTLNPHIVRYKYFLFS